MAPTTRSQKAASPLRDGSETDGMSRRKRNTERGSVTPAPAKTSKAYGGKSRIEGLDETTGEPASTSLSNALSQNVVATSSNTPSGVPAKAPAVRRARTPSVRPANASGLFPKPIPTIEEQSEPEDDETSRDAGPAAEVPTRRESGDPEILDEDEIKTNSEKSENGNVSDQLQNENAMRPGEAPGTRLSSEKPTNHNTLVQPVGSVQAAQPATQSAQTSSHAPPAEELNNAKPSHSNTGGQQPPSGWKRVFEPLQTFNRPPFKWWNLPVYLALLTLALLSLIMTARTGAKYSERAAVSMSSWLGERASIITAGYVWKLEKQVTELKQEVAVMAKVNHRLEAGLAEVEQILPRALIVDRHSDGSPKIPEYFWQVLKNREDAPSWEKFIAKNKAEMESYVSSRSDEILQSALEKKRIVSSEVFIDMLASNYEKLQAELQQLSQDFNARFSTVQNEMSKSALQAVDERLLHGPTSELSLLAAANLIRNSENALRSVNFFSANLGAVVDPTLSSPTARRPYKSALEFLYRNSFLGPRGPNPPIAALEKWEEAGDCWCAALPEPGTKVISADASKPLSPAKAQLAVLMPFVIYPKTVTVEHIPKDGTLDIKAAPGEMELWASVPNTTALNLIAHRAVDIGLVSTLEEAFDRTAGAPYALDVSFVLIARWTYDIDAANHIQTYDVDIDLEQYSVATNKAVIRAKTNHGRQYTCLYRVRVGGLVKEFEEEKARDAAEVLRKQREQREAEERDAAEALRKQREQWDYEEHVAHWA